MGVDNIPFFNRFQRFHVGLLQMCSLACLVVPFLNQKDAVFLQNRTIIRIAKASVFFMNLFHHPAGKYFPDKFISHSGFYGICNAKQQLVHLIQTAPFYPAFYRYISHRSDIRPILVSASGTSPKPYSANTKGTPASLHASASP